MIHNAHFEFMILCSVKKILLNFMHKMYITILLQPKLFERTWRCIYDIS